MKKKLTAFRLNLKFHWKARESSSNNLILFLWYVHGAIPSLLRHFQMPMLQRSQTELFLYWVEAWWYQTVVPPFTPHPPLFSLPLWFAPIPLLDRSISHAYRTQNNDLYIFQLFGGHPTKLCFSCNVVFNSAEVGCLTQPYNPLQLSDVELKLERVE